MRLSEPFVTRSLLFIAPLVLGSTIAISPSQAASFASSDTRLTLENFTSNNDPLAGSDPLTFTNTATNAISSGDTANADANALATATPTQINQFSRAEVSGSGRDYVAFGQGVSATQLTFDPQPGYFRFDFQATLNAIATLTNPVPGESAEASSFVAFSIFDGSKEIDQFEATLTAGSPFKVVNTPYVYFTASDLNQLTNTAFVKGYYERPFDKGTQLTVQGATLSTAIATVPEPPMFAALVILPGLMWLKRRKLKAVPQEAISPRDHRFE